MANEKNADSSIVLCIHIRWCNFRFLIDRAILISGDLYFDEKPKWIMKNFLRELI